MITVTTLILGLAAYPPNRMWEAIDLLARSVRKNASASRLAVITCPLGRHDRAKCDAFGVLPYEIVDPVPDFDVTTTAGREARRAWVLSMYASRHRLYLEVLDRSDETHVLLSDTRDAIVTSPFEEIRVRDTLILSQEDSRHTLAGEHWNRKWLSEGYGHKGIKRIGDRPILCAGAVFGPRLSVRAYVEAMSQEVMRLGAAVTQQIGDQPLHNYLAYTGQLPEFVVSRAEDGWIRSIGVMPVGDVGLDWGLPRESPPGGNRAVVIHQYDRHWNARRMKHAVWRAAGLNVLGQYGKQIGPRTARYIKRQIKELMQKPRNANGTCQ